MGSMLRKRHTDRHPESIWVTLKLGITGEEAAIYGWDYLSHPENFTMKGAVAIVGGGMMGRSIAVKVAQQGIHVRLKEASEGRVDACRVELERELKQDRKLRLATAEIMAGLVPGAPSLIIAIGDFVFFDPRFEAGLAHVDVLVPHHQLYNSSSYPLS